MIIVIALLVFFNINPVMADFVTTTKHTPYYNNFNAITTKNKPPVTIVAYDSSRRQNRLYPRYCPRCKTYNPYISKGNLNSLEKYALNKTYRREDDLQRLERLENLAFGATQNGDLLSRYQNVENAILSRPQYRVKRSILGNLANYIVGEPTGFTPNVSDFGGFATNPYSFTPNYNNHSFEQYSNGIFGRGWYHSGNNYGTGSSIRILD